MKIAFLTPRDISTPSKGYSHYCMAKTIKESVGEMIPVIYPKPPRRFSYGWFVNEFVGKPKSTDYGKEAVRHGRNVEKLLRSCDYDILFAPMGAKMVAELNIDKPIVYLSDSTYEKMNGYYLPKEEPESLVFKERNGVEKKAYEKAAKIVLTNRWAYDSIIEDYHVDPAKAVVIHSGPNLDRVPEREELEIPSVGGELRVLMIGRFWDRKGGRYGLDLMEECKKRNIPASLTICGMIPPVDYDKERIHVYPFLDKAKEEDFKKILDIYQTSHFLLYPSRAECHGLATNEANALGVPVIANRTGGIPDYIKPGENGDLVEPEGEADAYLEAMLKYFRNEDRYRALRVSSRDEYEARLNWGLWGERMKRVFRELV